FSPLSGLVPARSVASWRRTAYDSGGSRFFHSSSERTSFWIFAGDWGSAAAATRLSAKRPAIVVRKFLRFMVMPLVRGCPSVGFKGPGLRRSADREPLDADGGLAHADRHALAVLPAHADAG